MEETRHQMTPQGWNSAVPVHVFRFFVILGVVAGGGVPYTRQSAPGHDASTDGRGPLPDGAPRLEQGASTPRDAR